MGKETGWGKEEEDEQIDKKRKAEKEIEDVENGEK